jgi:catechol 2,3-dioxygenase-like lactoylglutathione lyase family enzyme
METMIQKVGQVGIPVKNMERAIKFYKETLQLPLLFKTDNLAFFDCDGVRLLLSLPETEEFANASSVLYFQVENIHASYEKLKAKDVRFIDEPHIVGKMGQTEIWMAFYKDSEENTHAFMSEVTGA